MLCCSAVMPQVAHARCPNPQAVAAGAAAVPPPAAQQPRDRPGGGYKAEPPADAPHGIISTAAIAAGASMPCLLPESAAMQCVQGSADWSVADVVAANQVNGDCSATLVAALSRHISRSIKHRSSLPSSLMQDRTKLPHHVVPAETGRGQRALPISEMLIQIVGFH